MAKRKSLLANIDMEEGQEVEPVPTTVVPIAPPQVEAIVSKPNKTSLYLPPKAHHKLKEIALAKDCKVHDLVISGIDKVLKENGFPTVLELSK